MALEMRESCERCEAALGPEGEAFICSYECTFCGPCTHAMDHLLRPLHARDGPCLPELRRRAGAAPDAPAALTHRQRAQREQAQEAEHREEDHVRHRALT